MKKIIFTIVLLAITGISFSGSPEKKSLLFDQIKDLRFQIRLDEYTLNLQSFGQQSPTETLQAGLIGKKQQAEKLEKEYLQLLTDTEKKNYDHWKQDEEKRDKSNSMNWWYPVFGQRGC